MAETVIKVEKLGKQYEIGSRGNSMNFRDKLVEIVNAPFNFLSGKKRIKKSIWALKDVSFEVKKGEVIGIIGRNGAGKSTLLKILSRITEPTTGQITLNGRVSSLLEVGTGFHPELTGRENIYLNGAILGMKKKEIDNKFSEIVKFSGVEKFLDTPVKKYSSGMYVRLAFAVAAHLEPEILLVDEVLAVGDVEFQKKCLGKMKDVATSGRTVLFVSHNMSAIENLCQKCILIEDGKIKKYDTTSKTINAYLNVIDSLVKKPLTFRTDRKGDGRLVITKIEFLESKNNQIQTGKPFIVRLNFKLGINEKLLKNVAFSFTINDLGGAHLLAFWSETTHHNFNITKKSGYIDCQIRTCPLLAGEYLINVYCTVNGAVSDYVINAAKVLVDEGDYFKNGRIEHDSHPRYVVEHTWDLSTK